MDKFQKELLFLQKSINQWVKTASKTKTLSKEHIKQQDHFSTMLPLLTDAIKLEETKGENLAETQILEGFQSQLVIDPKYRDIKDLQPFLSEDNIRDTNPILILSFNKLIELTIDYLQNLAGMLKILSQHCHPEDEINFPVKKDILSLFTGNDANSYELNEHIRTVLDQTITEFFSTDPSDPKTLSNFCDGLASQIEDLLIKDLQTKKKKELRKLYGKKFRKHKKSPYPFISKILTAIELNDIPFDSSGDDRKKALLKKLSIWYNTFLQELLKFEAQTTIDFLNHEKLSKALNGLGDALDIEITPLIGKTTLIDNVLSKIPNNAIIKASDIVPVIKAELDVLRASIKSQIESETFSGSEEVDSFIGINPSNYFDFIKTALEEDQFKGYKKVIKDWIKDVDKLMNSLGVHTEAGRYNYRSKEMLLNLDRVFKVKHDLFDANAFLAPIKSGLKEKKYSIELSEIDTLFSQSIATGAIYKTLIPLYSKSMQDGTFADKLDTLETSLPSVKQIQNAILKSRIDLVLNREIVELKLQYKFVWTDRNNIITMLIDAVINKADIAGLCQNFITILEQQSNNGGGNGGGGTTPNPQGDSWKEWAQGILRSITELPQRLMDALTEAVRELLIGGLATIADVVTEVRNFLNTQLNAGGGLNIPDPFSDTILDLAIPLSVGLEEDEKGGFLPYLKVLDGIDHSNIFLTSNDENPYTLSGEGFYSKVQNVKGVAVPSTNTLTVKFKDEGYSLSTDLSLLFISAGISTVEDEFEKDFNIKIDFTSNYNKATNEVYLSDIKFTDVKLLSFQKEERPAIDLLDQAESNSMLSNPLIKLKATL